MFEGPVVAQQLEDAIALLTKATAEPAWQLGDDQVDQLLERCVAAESALGVLRARLVAEADSRGMRERTAAPSTQRWLTDRLRLSRARSERLLREASLLDLHPGVRDALATGACHLEQALVIGQVLTDLPASVDDDARSRAAGLLVEQCAALDAVALARAGRRLVETLTTEPDTDDPAEQAAVDAEADDRGAATHHARSLTWRTHGDGSVIGRFRLDPAAGQLFATAITALAHRPDPLTDSGRSAGAGVLDGDTVPATETCGLTSPATTDTRTGPQRKADALLTLVQRAAKTDQLPDSGGVTTTLLVTTTLDSLEGRAAAAGLLPYGGPLDPASLRMLACDAAVIPAVLDGTGHVLDLGRTRRLFTPAQRRAITLRDQGCIHPGCHAAPADCDAHHAIPWYSGGKSDLDNGYLLCRYDHQRHHREGWTISRDQAGNPYVVPPRSIDPQQRPRQHLRYQTQRLRT